MILLAKRCVRPMFPPGSGRTPAQKLGLRYERKVVKQLTKQFGAGFVEYNPWYNYQDETGFHACSPDVLLHTFRKIFVIEIKYTLTPESFTKISQIYQTVVSIANASYTWPVIIYKNYREGVSGLNSIPTVQWLGRGLIEIPGL